MWEREREGVHCWWVVWEIAAAVVTVRSRLFFSPALAGGTYSLSIRVLGCKEKNIIFRRNVLHPIQGM